MASDLYEFQVGAHFAVLIEYGEDSHLETEEVDAMYAFMRHAEHVASVDGYDIMHWTTGDGGDGGHLALSDSAGFGRCEVTGLRGELVKLYLVVKDK